MFRRREALGPAARVKGWFWPRSGWRRTLRYGTHRIGRMRGSPHGIAAGLACGTAVAMTPLMGLHFLLAALLAILVRGSIVASVVGTFILNPWTAPLIWIGSHEIGELLLRGHIAAVAGNSPIAMIDDAWDAAMDLRLDAFVEDILPTFLPMLIGSLPLAALVWFVTYWATRSLIHSYRRNAWSKRAARLRGDGDRTDGPWTDARWP